MVFFTVSRMNQIQDKHKKKADMRKQRQKHRHEKTETNTFQWVKDNIVKKNKVQGLQWMLRGSSQKAQSKEEERSE